MKLVLVVERYYNISIGSIGDNTPPAPLLKLHENGIVEPLFAGIVLEEHRLCFDDLLWEWGMLAVVGSGSECAEQEADSKPVIHGRERGLFVLWLA